MRAFAWFVGTLLCRGASPRLRSPTRSIELTSTLRRVAVSSGRQPPRHAGRGRRALLAVPALGIATKRGSGLRAALATVLQVCALWGALGIATAAVWAPAFCSRRICACRPKPSLRSRRALRLLLVALSSGIAVALIEETVMRGAMHTAIERESGELAAALLTAPLFAVLHFFAKRAHSGGSGQLEAAASICLPARSRRSALRRWCSMRSCPGWPWDFSESHARAHREHRGEHRVARRLGRGAAHAAGSDRAGPRRRVFRLGRPRSTGCWGTGSCHGRRASRSPCGCAPRVGALRLAARALASGASEASRSSRSSGSTISR